VPAVILAEAGIQISLKFLDSGWRFLHRRISLRLKLSPAARNDGEIIR